MNYTKGETQMAAKPYDATKEHAPVDKATRKDPKGRHPNKNKPGKPTRSYS
jgi:hypothetical protein